MKAKQTVAAILAALLLSGGATFGVASAAIADDVTPVDVPVIEVAPEVVPETVVEETQPEVVVEDVPQSILAPAPTTFAPFVAPAPAAVDEPKYNDPAWWAANYQFEHEVVQCYKDSHGSVTNDGKAVTLYPYGADWPGDHYELLVVKAGSTDFGNGPGNLVYDHPSAGEPYFAPTGDNGKVKDVSHWIVCKGITPEEPDVAKADYGYNPATCTTGESVVIDNVNLTNATWTAASLLKNGTVGPAEFDIEAVLNEGAVWADGQTGLFHVVLDGPDTSLCPENVQCEVYTDGGTATQLDANGWVPFDTRPKGHAVFVENGLHIFSDPAAGESPDQRKLQWQKDVTDFPLSQVGQFDADYDATSGTSPGVKIVVEFTPGVFGTLIWEQIYDVAGEQDLWLPESANAAITAPDNGGGFGSTRHGTVNEWLTKYPNAVVVAIQFGNGSGVDFDGVLHSVSAGCATYDFDRVDIPVSIQFNVEAPTAQCGIAGELPNLGELPEGVTRTVTGGDGGPGVYTITFAALLGYVINGQSVFEIVVPEALDYQNENNEAPCFVEPKQNEIVNGQAPCGVATYPITTTVFTLDPATGEYDDGVATVTQGEVEEVQLCEGLAFTGKELPLFLIGGVIFALLIGTTMVLVPVGNRRGWFNQA